MSEEEFLKCSLTGKSSHLQITFEKSVEMGFISLLTLLSLFSPSLFSALVFTFPQIIPSHSPQTGPTCFVLVLILPSASYTGPLFPTLHILSHLSTNQVPPLLLPSFRAQMISGLFRVLWPQTSVSPLLWGMEVLTHRLPCTIVLLSHLLYFLLLTKDALHV